MISLLKQRVSTMSVYQGIDDGSIFEQPQMADEARRYGAQLVQLDEFAVGTVR